MRWPLRERGAPDELLRSGQASFRVRVYAADWAGPEGTARGGRRTSLPEQLGQTSAISPPHVVQNVHS